MMTEPVEASPKGGRGRVVVAGAVAAAVVLGGGGAFAFSMLSGGGPQPADVMPSTMQAYARLDLDPSAGQKVAFFKLVRKLPEAAKELDKAEDIDLRRLALEDILGDMCEDLVYDKDVEPWLGKRIGVGANLADEQFLVAAQVTDEAKARKGIDKISQCGGQEIGLAFVDGYALMSDSQKSVDDAIDANAKQGTLGDSKNFTADMDKLGEPGIASAWFDGEAVGDALEDSGLAPADMPQLDQLKDAGSGAFAVRVADSAIEFAAVTDSTSIPDVDPVPIGDLPADTVVALSLSGLGPQVNKQFDALRDTIEQGLGGLMGPSVTEFPFDSGVVTDPEGDLTPAPKPGIAPGPDVVTDPDFDDPFDSDTPFTDEYSDDFFGDSQAPPPSIDDMLDRFESETGLRMPDDLATLLGTTFTLAVGQANLENVQQMKGPADLENLDVAIRSQGDPAEAKDVMDTLAALAADNGVPLISEKTDDGAVLATNAKAAKALVSGGELGDDDDFEDVMPYGDDTLQGLYIDAADIIEAIRKSDPPESMVKDLKQVEAVSGVGVSMGQIDDDWVGFSIRVAFDD